MPKSLLSRKSVSGNVVRLDGDHVVREREESGDLITAYYQLQKVVVNESCGTGGTGSTLIRMN